MPETPREHPLDLRIVDKTPDMLAAVDQLRQQARDEISRASMFLVTWDDGAGGVTYTAYAGDTGGDALAFFAYSAARALKAFIDITESSPEKASAAVLEIVREHFT